MYLTCSSLLDIHVSLLFKKVEVGPKFAIKENEDVSFFQKINYA